MPVDPDEIETVVLSRPSMATPTPAPRGERFAPGALLASRYRIVSKLGKGGMGEVFRADDLILGQQVALKFLPESAKKNVNLLTRFYDEVRIARQISHKNVCRVYDIGEVEGQLYLSMEYIDGEDLGSLLRRIGRLPSDKALEFTRKLCAGVAAAHQQGVLHRDLKPANIMIDGKGELSITDFGLAAMSDSVTGAEVRNGTPLYMAPEQLTGREVSVQSDIYALGLVLYEMFTGKQPHQASTVAEMTRLRQESTASSLSTLVHDIDPIVEKAILKCLEPDPKMRPASAMALAASLPGGDPLSAALAAGETPSPAMVAASGSNETLPRKIVLLALAAIVVLLVALCVVIPSFHLANKVPLVNPPEVLTAKARDIVRALGYTDAPADWAIGFNSEGGYLGYLQKELKTKDWDRAMRLPPSIGFFYYRESPVPLATDRTSREGRISDTEPPLSRSGMRTVSVDLDGRLRMFHAVARESEPAPEGAKPNWDALFAAAQLDRSQFHETDPQWTPLVPSDARAAWTGVYPGGMNVPVRIEAAAFHGRPVYFETVWPWTKPRRDGEPSSKNPFANAADVLTTAVTFLALAGAAWTAHYNWRAGRGDLAGALRVGICIGGAGFLSAFLAMHHTYSDGEGSQIGAVFYWAVGQCALFWLSYLALEPWVRRIWPKTMVTWSRALAGKWRDPMVGRDLLFGVLGGLLYCLFIEAFEYTSTRLGDTAFSDLAVENILGFRMVAASLVRHVEWSLTGAVAWFLILFFGKALLRKEWAAGAAFVALMVATKIGRFDDTTAFAASAVFWIVLYGLIVATLLRFGLFALVVTLFFIDATLNTYYTNEFGAWYGQSSWIMIVMILGTAFWGARLALGGKPLFAPPAEHR